MNLKSKMCLTLYLASMATPLKLLWFKLTYVNPFTHQQSYISWLILIISVRKKKKVAITAKNQYMKSQVFCTSKQDPSGTSCACCTVSNT